jgi:hypothetical protein
MTEPAPAEITAYLDVTTGTPEGVDVIFIPGTRIAEPAQIAATMLDHDVASVAVLTGGINHGLVVAKPGIITTCWWNTASAQTDWS